MSPAPEEILELQVPARLDAVRAAARRIEAHLRLRGLDRDAWQRLELAVVEGLNNAVLHGCAEHPAAPVVVRVGWSGRAIRLEIRDPGHFVPAANWGELPDDPLAEHGRGGFLMREAFARVEHHNDERGHLLVLATELPHAASDPARAMEACDATLDLIGQLETAYETAAGLRFLASLLAKSTAPGELVERTLARLHAIDGFAFAYVRLVRRTHLEFDRGWGDLPMVALQISLGDDTAETRAVLTQTTQSIDACDTLPAGDPLHRAGGPAVVLPICSEDQRVGTLTIVRSRDRAFFTAGSLQLIQTAAEFFGVAWATAQLQQRQRDLEFTAREFTLAGEMQARLLPERFPDRPDVRFAGSCRSAQTAGGDFFDVFATDGGTLLVIADAMGKGLPAAFVASVLRATVRARSHLAGDPGALLTAVNAQLTADLLALDIFVTAQLAFVPHGATEARLASAGHCPAFIRRHGGDVTTAEASGFPLGILADTTYPTEVVPLAPGDAIVLLTDGLYEIGPDAAHLLGLDGVRAIIASTTGDAEETAQAIMSATDAQIGNGAAADDRTLLLCERIA